MKGQSLELAGDAAAKQLLLSQSEAYYSSALESYKANRNEEDAARVASKISALSVKPPTGNYAGLDANWIYASAGLIALIALAFLFFKQNKTLRLPARDRYNVLPPKTETPALKPEPRREQPAPRPRVEEKREPPRETRKNVEAADAAKAKMAAKIRQRFGLD